MRVRARYGSWRKRRPITRQSPKVDNVAIVRAASLLEEKASLVACPKLDWDAIPGLSETLGLKA